MAIIIKTKHPNILLNSFKTLVQTRKIITWLVDEEDDFTIANPKWTYMAWMRPISEEENGLLVFGFVSSTKYQITKGLYGIYHGRLAVTILSHFDNLIDSIIIEPNLNPKYDSF